MDRNDLEYQAKVIDQKSQDSPKEIAIREKVRAAVLREAWAREAFQRIRQQQIDYLREAAAKVHDGQYVHSLTQRVLGDISREVKAKVVEGGDLLREVPRGSPVIIATNHFGAYKLLGICPREDVGVDIRGYKAMYPYLMYFAALKPIADALGDNLYYASNDFPGVFGDIHREAGFIHVPPVEKGKTAFLIDETREAIRKRQNSAIVSFPEGTTSGKPSGRGPYDLEPFTTGTYVIAA